MPRKKYSFAFPNYTNKPKPIKSYSLDIPPAPAGVPIHLPGFKNYYPVKNDVLSGLYRRQPFYPDSKRYHYKLELPSEPQCRKKWANADMRNKSKDPNSHSLRPESTKKLQYAKWYNPVRLILKDGKRMAKTRTDFNKTSLTAGT
jgi:hypothetical protein